MGWKASDLPRRLYELSVDHWIASAVIPTFPGWFGLYLNYFGLQTGLLAAAPGLPGSRSITWWGAFWLVVVFVFSSTFALVKSYVGKYEKAINKNSVSLLQRLLSSVNAVTGAKLAMSRSLLKMGE